MFVVKALFPGYDKPEWFYIVTLPKKTMLDCEQWFRREGTNNAPYGSHTWFSKTKIPSELSAPSILSFFPQRTEDAQAIKKWLRNLRRLAVKKRLRTETVPEWILNEPRIDKNYGLKKESR